jgi:hypothetical protein
MIEERRITMMVFPPSRNRVRLGGIFGISVVAGRASGAGL